VNECAIPNERCAVSVRHRYFATLVIIKHPAIDSDSRSIRISSGTDRALCWSGDRRKCLQIAVVEEQFEQVSELEENVVALLNVAVSLRRGAERQNIESQAHCQMCDRYDDQTESRRTSQ
jgi:hypothetical protein